MKTLFRGSIVCAVVLGLTVSSLADKMPGSLAKAYLTIRKSIASRNFPNFSNMFDESFVLVNPAGQSVTRGDFMSMIKPLFETSDSAQARENTHEVLISGNYAEVRFTLDVVLQSKQGTTRVHEEGSDFWVKKDGRWKLYRTVETKFDVSGPN
ncbi:MAG: nuclear transport factor 2 family protein [Chthonomonadaceae bacterium]|nr:nuclear transport factor 2 family protein [Chthonomonadaceae bacterium]